MQGRCANYYTTQKHFAFSNNITYITSLVWVRACVRAYEMK